MDWKTINITRHTIITWITKNPTEAEFKSIRKLIRTYGKLTNQNVHNILQLTKTFDELSFFRIIKFLSIDKEELSDISLAFSNKNTTKWNAALNNIKQEESWKN